MLAEFACKDKVELPEATMLAQLWHYLWIRQDFIALRVKSQVTNQQIETYFARI